jgi:26S proteasome non-ATPase regulatory subunit 5
MAANSGQIQQVVQRINITQFFNQLNSYRDDSNIKLIVNVLESIISPLPTIYVLNRFQNEIDNGLISKNDLMIKFWVKTLDRCLSDESIVNNLNENNFKLNSIILKLVELLSKESPTIAKYCHLTLLNISKSNAVQLSFFDHNIQNKLMQIKQINEIVKMRVYELLVSIANISQLSLNRIENFGHLKDLLNDFDNVKEDPLVALNFIQIMTDLGSTPFGTQYLQNSDILKTIAHKLSNIENDIFANILIPGYIKMFGTIAHNEPNILNEYPIVLNKLLSLLDESDPNLIFCSIDAFANISLRNSGKKILEGHPVLVQNYLEKIGFLLRSGNTDFKTRALVSLSKVLQISESDPNGEVTALTESWFRQLFSDGAMSLLLSLCKEPLLEIKLEAFECVRVLATHIWGHKELAAFPGFLEYILNRSTEFSKEGKESKYNIVRELVSSPFIGLSFAPEAVQRLRKFYSEGPYFVTSETAVAFESN